MNVKLNQLKKLSVTDQFFIYRSLLSNHIIVLNYKYLTVIYKMHYNFDILNSFLCIQIYIRISKSANILNLDTFYSN